MFLKQCTAEVCIYFICISMLRSTQGVVKNKLNTTLLNKSIHNLLLINTMHNGYYLFDSLLRHFPKLIMPKSCHKLAYICNVFNHRMSAYFNAVFSACEMLVLLLLNHTELLMQLLLKTMFIIVYN